MYPSQTKPTTCPFGRWTELASRQTRTQDKHSQYSIPPRSSYSPLWSCRPANESQRTNAEWVRNFSILPCETVTTFSYTEKPKFKYPQISGNLKCESPSPAVLLPHNDCNLDKYSTQRKGCWAYILCNSKSIISSGRILTRIFRVLLRTAAPLDCYHFWHHHKHNWTANNKQDMNGERLQQALCWQMLNESQAE